jgi:peroxin-6
VASHLPLKYTGADFYALCSDAMLKAVTRQASLVDAKVAQINGSAEQQRKGTKLTTAQFFDHHATKEDVAVMVKEEDFLQAMKELIPSVSAGELEHYQTVRRQFEKVDDGARKNGTNGAALPILENKETAREPTGATILPERPRSKGKGRERAVDRKGKGKASSLGESDEEYDGGASMNGHKGKGKGKAVDMSFHDDEDEELY